jgi:hypothetical protein
MDQISLIRLGYDDMRMEDGWREKSESAENIWTSILIRLRFLSSAGNSHGLVVVIIQKSTQPGLALDIGRRNPLLPNK